MKRAILLLLISLLSETVFSQDGTLDSSFGVGGVVTNPFGSLGINAGSSVILQDGKIVVLGKENSLVTLVKYIANGTLDTSFGVNGVAQTNIGIANITLREIKLLSDGTFIVFFHNIISSEYVNYLAKFSSQGSLDTSFGTNGVVTIQGKSLNSITIQSDDKILLAGGNVSSNNNCLLRFLANGMPDLNFGASGFVTTFFPFNSYRYYDCKVQNDGKIVAVGLYVENSPTTIIKFIVARYNSNGVLDASFGNNGITISPIIQEPGASVGYLIYLLSDDSILVCGGNNGYSINNNILIAKLNNNGVFDSTFGNGGIVLTDVFSDKIDRPSNFAIQNDNKLVALSQSFDSNNNKIFSLSRFNLDGSLDTSFNSTGSAVFDGNEPLNHDFSCVLLQNDGKIVVSGYSGLPKSLKLFRFNATPLSNENFSSQSVVLYPNPTNGIIYFDNSLRKYEKVIVYNQLGQQILIKKTNFSLSEIVDLSGLPNGVYMLKVLNEEETITKNIIKN